MPPRGRYPKGVAKRDEILDTALAIFARNGYDRTSFREIARATGLSQAGLLHHFNSKEELFIEVLRRRDDRNQQRHDEQAGHALTAEGLLSVVRDNSTEPGLVRLFVAMSAESTAADSPAREFFAARYETLRAGIASDIRRQQDQGTINRELRAEVVASLLIAAADGLQIQWLLEPDSVDMGAQLEQLWNAVRQLAAATDDSSRREGSGPA